MINCPHCNRPAMTPWQKAALGPGRVVGCQSCGKKIAAHWTAILAAIPAFLGGYALLRADSVLLGVSAVVAGILLMALLHTFVVPLIRSDS